MTEATLADLKADPHNARLRTERSAAMLSTSIEELGFGRSIVVDGQNQIVAGHGTVDACAAAGIEKVLIIDTTGHEVIALRRADLTPEQARRLAYLDNRSSELA